MHYLQFLARYLLVGICFLGILKFGINHISYSSDQSEKSNMAISFNLSAHRGVNGEFVIPNNASDKTINSFTSANLSRSHQPSWQAEKSPIVGGGIVVPVPMVRSHSIADKEKSDQGYQLRIRDNIHTHQNNSLTSTDTTHGVNP